MKRFDDSTKKLIKNFAALLTSALVLIAATVAWFTSGGTTSYAGLFKGSLQQSLVEIKYYKMGTVDYVLQSATTGTGSSALFTYAPDPETAASGTFTQPTLASRMEDATWTQSDGTGAWSINSFYPGEYGVFKMDFSSGASSVQIAINDISCSSTLGSLTPAQKETVYRNVFLYAVAVETTKDETTNPATNSYAVIKDTNNADLIVCDSLYELLDKTAQGWSVDGTQTISILSGIHSSKPISVLLFIGIPGASVDGSSTQSGHAALSRLGAQVSFGPAVVVAG